VSRGEPAARPLVIAHRGASAYRPENTLAAYELAVEQDADMIEIDLHLSQDAEIVIAHDAGLARIGGQGEIGDAPLAEIRALDAGGGEPAPTLDEVLDGFGQRIAFNLEIKSEPGRGPYPGLEAATLDAVRSRGLLERTLFSCFDDRVLETLRSLEPAARLAVLVSARQPERMLERAEAVAAEAVNPFLSLATGEFVAQAHDRGLKVYPYTADEPEWLERLLAAGVDGIFTNVPDRLRGMLPRE
jgi:glycerophosphoryl diester phosphodiesterase